MASSLIRVFISNAAGVSFPAGVALFLGEQDGRLSTRLKTDLELVSGCGAHGCFTVS